MVLAIECGGLRQERGISNYINNLIEGLSSKNLDFKVILIVPRGCNFSSTNNQIKVIPANYFLQPLWESIIVPIVALLNNAKCLHYTGNTGGFLLPVIFRIKTFVTIHDVSYMKKTSEIPLSKSYYQNLGRLYRRFNVPYIAKKCDVIFTVSSFAKEDIVNSTFVDEKKITISYNSVNKIFFSTVNMQLKKKEILIVSGNSPQKNLIPTLNCLNSCQKPDCWKIKIVGVTENDIDISKFNQPISILGDVSKEELLDLYNKASILIMPSLYESFAIPLIEAMSRGVSIIASNRGAVSEVSGEFASLYNPSDCISLKKQLIKVISRLNEATPNDMDKQINHARSFNIEQQTMPVINEYLIHLK